jgi:ribosomal protein S18 acetylase RimI-like enzyme
MHIRTADNEDFQRIKKLYTQVAAQEGGIARTEDEITDDYVAGFLTKAIDRGLIIVAEHPDNPDVLIGEMHAYRPGPGVFNHIYSQLTIVVHPDFQRKKIGRTLFTIFLEEVGLNRRNIGRVELIVRESNEVAIRFYQSFGFTIEGRLEMRIKTRDDNYEADIPMAWLNPNFEFDATD